MLGYLFDIISLIAITYGAIDGFKKINGANSENHLSYYSRPIRHISLKNFHDKSFSISVNGQQNIKNNKEAGEAFIAFWLKSKNTWEKSDILKDYPPKISIIAPPESKIVSAEVMTTFGNRSSIKTLPNDHDILLSIDYLEPNRLHLVKVSYTGPKIQSVSLDGAAKGAEAPKRIERRVLNQSVLFAYILQILTIYLAVAIAAITLLWPCIELLPHGLEKISGYENTVLLSSINSNGHTQEFTKTFFIQCGTAAMLFISSYIIAMKMKLTQKCISVFHNLFYSGDFKTDKLIIFLFITILSFRTSLSAKDLYFLMQNQERQFMDRHFDSQM